MLTVTDSACAHLSNMLDEADLPEGTAARLAVNDEGCLGIHSDTERAGDSIWEHEGRTVLLVDEQVAESVDERTLDTKETEEGVGLRLR